MEIFFQKLKNNWYKVYFILSLALASFAYGVIVCSFKIFPYRTINAGILAAQDWIKSDNYKHYLKIRPEKLIYPIRYSGAEEITNISGKTYEGFTFITSLWNNSLGMKLIDMAGIEIHGWQASFTTIFPNASHLDEPLRDWDTHIHGAILYPNGDVVFNFEHGGLVKIDQCSNVKWKLPYETHHSVHEDIDGNLWVPGRKFVRHRINNFPLIKWPIEEDMILKVSPDGKILKEISILDVIYKSGQNALLSANGKYETTIRGRDITHLNDIEVLNETIADKFPLFQAGDLMVSLRNLNLIIIIDPISEKIKWSMTGPFIRQHDPDFLENGNISVFDNQKDDHDGTLLGGSRILLIDPVTKNVKTLYKGNQQNNFFTNIMGKHQYLPNGNFLITESLAGRVFEITPSSQIVWSYINKLNDKEVYVVEQATRYSKQHLKFIGDDTCQTNS